MKKSVKILIGILCAVLLCVGAAFLFIRSGKDSLAEDTGAPDLKTDAEEEEEWESGWVRYEGEIYEYNEDILTFLIMGIDSEEGVGQADALFLAVLDTAENKISVLAINRAAMTDIDIYEDGEYAETRTLQICLQYAYGDGAEGSCEMQAGAVSGLLYNLTINGYAALYMEAVEDLNDAAGGITLTALEDVPALYWSGDENARDLAAGEEYTLSGVEAYWYVKYRDEHVEDSASGRLERQKQYIEAFINAIKENPSAVLSVITTASENIVTDISAAELTYLASVLPSCEIESEIYSLQGEKITAEAGAESGYDEFWVDEEGLYELMIELFYKKVQ